MNRLSNIIDEEIMLIEAEMEYAKKHVMKTDTLKERVLLHVHFDGKNDETKYVQKVGFGQVIQSRLYANGYRSIRMGLFVNLDRCEDIVYLQTLLKNADLAAEDKAMVRDRIKQLRDTKMTGQIEFDINGSVIKGLISPITEQELMDMLEADAV